MRQKLKIGLLLDGTQVPFWEARTIERIGQSEYAEIVLLVFVGETKKDHESDHSRESILYEAFKLLDKGMNKLSEGTNKPGHDPLAPEHLPTVLDEVSRVHLQQNDGDQRTIPQDIAKDIKERDLDALIDFSSAEPSVDFSSYSRYGVLSFSLGDGERYTGKYAGLWEILDGVPITGSHIRRIHDGKVSIIYRSYSSTAIRSEKINREKSYHKGISFLPRVLKALYYRGDDAFASCEKMPLTDLNSKDRSGPMNVDMINYYLRWVPKTAGYLARRMLFEELWTVRYKINNEMPTSFNGFTTIIPPPHTWWGDPRALKHGDDYYIFVEELHIPRRKNHGHIAVIKIDKDGRQHAPVNVLEMPYHLSYPFAFQWEGSYYMVLESSKVRTLEMYKATEFPYKWQHVKHLMTGLYIVDATLYWRNGLWWMFCNMKENEGAPPNDELFLFYSKDLLTEHWEPHPMNPIVSDVRNARPAGGVFEKDGVLYRPSQDCSQCYGYAININRIEELDERHYKEVRVAYIQPQEFGDASRVHTFNYIPGFTVVDTYMARPRLFRPR